MLPRVPGPVIDPVAVFAATADMMNAHNGWHDTLHGKANYMVDVKDFGAVGDGVTDDTDAIQTAADIATGGTLLFPPGTYRVSGTIVIADSNVEAMSATILTDADTGLQIGAADQSCDFRVLNLPYVKCSVWDWEHEIGSRRGVVVAAADGCAVRVTGVAGFSQGLVLEGDGHGVCYNTFTIQRLQDNAANLYVGSVNGGWSNQNTVLGGRFTHWNGGVAEVREGTAQIVVSQFSNNGNTFIGCSLEGAVAEFMLDCDGTGSLWEMCRWEGPSPAVRWGQNARRNIVEGGPFVDGIGITDLSDGSNAVLQPSKWGWVTV